MNIVITGARGFLGSHLVKRFKGQRLFLPSHSEYDLRKKEDVQKLLYISMPDMVIHLAANVGGIGYNQKHPAELFYDNAMMGINMMHESCVAGVKKFVQVGTICAYPKFTPTPFKEEDLWNGYPEETNAPYGLAKKMLLVQAQAYRKQYEFNAIYLLPVNLYGPNDNFDDDSSHVIPALIKKFVNAKDKVTVWGTGEATREFLYVKDAAEAIYYASMLYDKPDPINLGSGMEISIRDLVYLIAELTDFKGEIEWDTSKPDGQPKRLLDVEKAYKEFGFLARTDFREGLKETVKWYRQKYL